MNKAPLISIITPMHNSARFVLETICSVQAQTYHNWEMLIVDDCSTDDSVTIVRQLAEKDARIHLITLDKRGGAAHARNVALDVAKGRYIAFLDSDDLWMPEKLEKQLAFMQQHGYAFTFSNYQTMNEDGTLTGKCLQMPASLSYHQYLSDTAIGCLTVMIDKQQTGEFHMPDIRSSHDMALWLDIMKRGFPAYALQECLASYRLVATSNTAKKWKAAKEVWNVYRDIEKLNVVYSAYCFCGYAIHAVWKRI